MRHNDEPFGLPSTGSRRITTESKGENRLKHIAGLIQRLTFAEMKKLADLMHERTNTSGRNGIEEELLAVSEELLNQKD